jgi:hypothetical protein
VITITLTAQEAEWLMNLVRNRKREGSGRPYGDRTLLARDVETKVYRAQAGLSPSQVA